MAAGSIEFPVTVTYRAENGVGNYIASDQISLSGAANTVVKLGATLLDVQPPEARPVVERLIAAAAGLGEGVRTNPGIADGPPRVVLEPDEIVETEPRVIVD